MAYNIDTSKATLPEALELLADAVLNPKLHAWEVAEQVRLRRLWGGGESILLGSPLLDMVLVTPMSGWTLLLLLLQVTKLEADVKGLKDNPQTTLLEGLHSVAYNGGLGRPLIVPDGCLPGLSAGVAGGDWGWQAAVE